MVIDRAIVLQKGIVTPLVSLYKEQFCMFENQINMDLLAKFEK